MEEIQIGSVTFSPDCDDHSARRYAKGVHASELINVLQNVHTTQRSMNLNTDAMTTSRAFDICLSPAEDVRDALGTIEVDSRKYHGARYMHIVQSDTTSFMAASSST